MFRTAKVGFQWIRICMCNCFLVFFNVISFLFFVSTLFISTIISTSTAHGCIAWEDEVPLLFSWLYSINCYLFNLILIVFARLQSIAYQLHWSINTGHHELIQLCWPWVSFGHIQILLQSMITQELVSSTTSGTHMLSIRLVVTNLDLICWVNCFVNIKSKFKHSINIWVK